MLCVSVVRDAGGASGSRRARRWRCFASGVSCETLAYFIHVRGPDGPSTGEARLTPRPFFVAFGSSKGERGLPPPSPPGLQASEGWRGLLAVLRIWSDCEMLAVIWVSVMRDGAVLRIRSELRDAGGASGECRARGWRCFGWRRARRWRCSASGVSRETLAYFIHVRGPDGPSRATRAHPTTGRALPSSPSAPRKPNGGCRPPLPPASRLRRDGEAQPEAPPASRNPSRCEAPPATSCESQVARELHPRGRVFCASLAQGRDRN